MKPIMFFDGGCPLCSREVAHYRRLDRERRIRWVDITREPAALEAHGIAYQDAMERLHVRDKDGRMLVGMPAFVALWRQLPGYRVLASVVTRLRLVGLLDRVYSAFAAWRYRRRCDGDLCARGESGGR